MPYPFLGFALDHPVILAAGMEKNLEGVHRAIAAGAAAITVGSFTLAARAGNAGATYWYEEGRSINSLGLPNVGRAQLGETLPAMVDACHDAGMPLVCSVAGFTPEEYADLAYTAAIGGADLVELNLSCPNVHDDDDEQRISCFSRPMVRMILLEVDRMVPPGTGIAVKVSPYSDPTQLMNIDQEITRFPRVEYLVTCNTFAGALALDDLGKVVISGGMAGPALLPIALGQVSQHRRALPERIRIIGVGGVSSGVDVQDMLTAGADLVGVATSYWNKPANLRRIAREYQTLGVKEVSRG